MINIDKSSQEKQNLLRAAARNHLLNFCQLINKDYETEWFHEKIASVLMRALSRTITKKKTRIILSIPPRHGKQIMSSTPILTPKGFKNHGDLMVGDYVYHPSGKAIKVLKIIPQEQLATYKVTLTDGSDVVVHENHEWTVTDRKKTTSGKLFTYETNELIGNEWMGEKGIRGSRARFQLPHNGVIKFKKQKTLIDPYTFGYWIGNGTTTKNKTITFNPATYEEVLKYIPYKPTWEYWHKTYGVPVIRFADIPKMKFKRKYIPDEYIYNSEEARRELLAGLIDSDGCIDKKTGRVLFSNTNKEVCDSFDFLVRTLGYYPNRQEEEPKLSSSGIQGTKKIYRVDFVVHDGKKVSNIKQKNIPHNATLRRRAIASIEKVKGGEGECITVDSLDGLYLVTENLIPTHNSQLASIYFPAWSLGLYPDLKFILTTYGAELSEEIGMKTRDVISNEGYQTIFPKTQLRDDTKSKAKWMTKQDGSYTAVGIGGAITGKGGNCVVPYCTIQTNRGTLPILKVKTGDKILGYDKKTNRAVWTTVRAVSASVSDKRVIRTGNLETTEDHRIYTRNRGYVPAKDIKSSDVLIELQPRVSKLQSELQSEFVGSKKEDEEWATKDVLFSEMLRDTKQRKIKRQKNMLVMWWSQSKSRNLLHKLLQKRTNKNNNDDGVQNMQEEFYTQEVRNRKSRTPWQSLMFLLKGVCFEGQRNKQASKNRHEHLCVLSEKKQSQWKVLFQRMLRKVSEREFFSNKLQWNMATSEDGGSGKRQSNMSFMRAEKNKTSCSSLRHEPSEQCNTKFSNSVHKVSQLSSSDESVSPESIAKLSGWKDYVVDIQTDTHNFFAIDILVSNCIIIDDPHKDRAAAESEVDRKTVWDYYRSTLYSRLEGFGTIIVIMQRWRDDDLVGLLLEEDAKIKAEDPKKAENWEVINFPAIAEDDEHSPSGELLRRKGEALWPKKYPLEFLSLIRQQSPYFWSCTPKETPILLPDLTTKPISEIKIGDEVVGFTGGISGKRSTLMKVKVKNVFSKKAIVNKLIMSNGENIRCTKEHRWLKRWYNKVEKNNVNPEWVRNLYSPARKNSVINFVDKTKYIFTNEQLMDLQYLAGIIDGEGAIQRSAIQISQSLGKNKVVFDAIINCLDRLKDSGLPIEYTVAYKDRSKVNPKWQKMADITIGNTRRIFPILIRYTHLAKKNEIIEKYWLHAHMPIYQKPKVMGIEVGTKEEDVYAIETESGNYIAWGYISSNSQYQQNPISQETAEFKKELFRYYEADTLKGKYLRYYTIIDPAISQKKSADNTVVLTVAKEVNGPNFYRIRETAGKFTPQQTVNEIFSQQKEFNSEVWIETVAYQAALKFMIEEERRKRQQFFILSELKSSTKKEERIRGLLGLYQAGVIWHLPNADLDYEYELLAFPRGKHDDRADTMAYILQAVRNTNTTNSVKQWKPRWLHYGKKA